MAEHRLGKNKGRWRTCCECSQVEFVQAYNSAERCLSCAARERGAKGNATIRARMKRNPCAVCGAPTLPKYKHCSRACRVAATAWLDQTCKECGKGFKFRAASVKTNATGNFCSRPCYNLWLCNSARVSGRGSRWSRHRAEAKRRNPFCALCATPLRLQVHHVIPFRITLDNGQENLIPLCLRHHKIVESITLDVLAAGGTNEIIKIVLGSILREHQAASRTVLKEIIDAA